MLHLEFCKHLFQVRLEYLQRCLSSNAEQIPITACKRGFYYTGTTYKTVAPTHMTIKPTRTKPNYAPCNYSSAPLPSRTYNNESLRQNLEGIMKNSKNTLDNEEMENRKSTNYIPVTKETLQTCFILEMLQDPKNRKDPESVQAEIESGWHRKIFKPKESRLWQRGIQAEG